MRSNSGERKIGCAGGKASGMGMHELIRGAWNLARDVAAKYRVT